MMLVIWALALGLGLAGAFNLEARMPIVKRGARGSYFGFSVAEHQQDRGDRANPRYLSWMLIGAPLDQNRQPGTNKSGALWKCPMTTDPTDCEQVITDGRIDTESERLQPPGPNEVNDNQWLGVVVRSGGVNGKVMVCAHRYIVKTVDSQWGQGQCYILTPELKFQELKKPCSGKPTYRGHNQYGYCQAGTSGVLTPTDDYVAIGTPGPYTWRGAIYVISVSDDILNKDTVVYNSPMEDNGGPSPVPMYGYLGMSVTVGDFFGNGSNYAAGAPRSNGTGQVILFSKSKGVPKMDLALVINGEQFASSFGYELASADVNGDGASDLIVAAPFYYGKGEGGAVYIYTKLCRNMRESDRCRPTKLVGKEETRFGFALTNLKDLNKDGYEDIAVGAPYEGKGAVYVYLGSKHGLITTPSQVIRSEDTPMPLSTFGYSLSGGLDMDKNGYPDLLIGAYEENAVALLRARKIIDVVSFVRYPTKSGGYQISTDPIDPYKTGCLGDPDSNYTCFTFEACCKTASIEKDERIRKLRLRSYLEAETYSGSKKFSRVWFGSDQNKPHYISWIASLDASSSIHCRRETVYLKEGTRDIQSPIKLRLNYTLIQEEPEMPRQGDPLPDINNHPILNQQEAAKIFEVSFQKDCGNNDICESDLNLKASLNLTKLHNQPNYYELLLGESPEVVVDVSVTNDGESAYEANLYVAHSSNLSYIGTKHNESAICSLYNATLVSCIIGNPFKRHKTIGVQVRFDPKDLEDSEVKLGFTVFANSTSKEIYEKKPLRLHAKVLKRAELSINGSARAQKAVYGGPVVGESAIKKLSDVGPKVAHVYEVFNEGPWKVGTLEVIISWPYEVANDKPHGKWLLYLEAQPTVNGTNGAEGECRVPEGRVNPLGLQVSIGTEDLLDPLFPDKINDKNSDIFSNQTNFVRRKRDTEKVVASKIVINESGHKETVVSMNCKAGTAKCFEISCLIYNLQKKEEALIIVKARLWNSTLAEDYPRVDKVKIGSNAKIHVPSHVVIQQDNWRNDYAVAETIATPDHLDQQEAEPVPIWIIIVAIVAGLLLLILLTLILWKLGFFKRRRPDHTLSGNLQKYRDDNPENEALVKRSKNSMH